jgi:hypothetical protein
MNYWTVVLSSASVSKFSLGPVGQVKEGSLEGCGKTTHVLLNVVAWMRIFWENPISSDFWFSRVGVPIQIIFFSENDTPPPPIHYVHLKNAII